MTNNSPEQPDAIQPLHPRAIRMALERVLEHRKLNPQVDWLKPILGRIFDLKESPAFTESDDALVEAFSEIKNHDAEEEWIDAHLNTLLHRGL